jgi:hypothetical protein
MRRPTSFIFSGEVVGVGHIPGDVCYRMQQFRRGSFAKTMPHDGLGEVEPGRNWRGDRRANWARR